jgi:diguanylate cyclase (GGDEF)-like protein
MNLSDAIENLRIVVTQITTAALSDDKTPLGNFLALSEQGKLFNTGESSSNIVIFGDLNRFKALNDAYGHDVGDEAIQQAGLKLQGLLEENPKEIQAFRRSGDEFVVLTTSAYLEKFLEATESFAKLNFNFENQNLSVAMSFGYTESDGEASFGDLIKRAESACLAAKRRGDGVCVEWTADLEKEKYHEFRKIECKGCGAIVTCEVPDKSEFPLPKVCPCCEKSISP